MPIALLSVSDKRGIVEFARSLAERGWEMVSTGGTARALRGGDVPVREVSELTGFPELMGGRVKTVHPAVHAGILARRTVASDMEELRKHDLSPIDLVVVNLYPFRETVANPNVAEAEALSQIDIGGPTLLRAAAKNHPFVWSVCDPDDFDDVLAAMDGGDEEAAGLRQRLAAKVFLHTASYDAAIASHLESRGGAAAGAGLPTELLWPLERVQELRYGENPDQRAAFYRDPSGPLWGVPGLRQLQGKELSYNNLLDVDGALLALSPFLQGQMPACVVIKHTTPCGLATGRTLAEAFQKARACDPMSAFGSTVAFNQPVTEAAAEAMSDLFVECLVAPGYASGALRILRSKEKVRILEPADGVEYGRPRGHVRRGLEARGIQGGVLVQGAREPVDPEAVAAGEGVTVATSRRPSEEEWADMGFAWAAIQGVKSNAILLARDGATIGIGAGQMSRVDAVKIAVRKAGEADLDTAGSALASDAFFPFRDNIDVAAEAGIRAIIQPGGSIRDEEVIEAADEHGIAMVLTGRRLFRH
ncbi:MAG TPA: bifunctional phosphoribosylaminoimidazolecarboxamide formyltransferase/IMP cyclohydrolase [Gemmatimonadota bacterium]|nr:bifunctional phosphoribosylaminoimidazolecarboxamide formyltransferase/IMP cyclohydrolase [Gemmatimonadota bacterium]